MKGEYQIGQKVILSRKCSCLAGINFEKGQEVTICEIDPVRGYGFTDDDGNRIIECGWDCIEKAAVSEDNPLSEEKLEAVKQASIKIFDTMVKASGVKKTLSNKFDSESVEFIMKSVRNAFMTGFDCCSEYISSVLQED